MKFGSKILAFFVTIALTTVFGRAQNIPSIIVQPSSQATAPSGTISFSVSVSGAGTLVYQWAKNTTNLANGIYSGRATVSGATTSTLTLTSVTTNDQANYICTVTNSFGSITSSIASLTVYVAPTITTQPIGSTNVVGSHITFTVVASGSAPLTYQWQFNSADIPSASLNVYTINNVGTNNSGGYTVSVNNPAGSVNSSAAQLLILNPPVITIQPTNQSVMLSNSVTFSVIATGDLLTYQWQKSGAPIKGATNNSYTITNATYSLNAFSYNVIVTNYLKTITSSSATLSVIGLPIINVQPGNQTAGVGSNATFSVSATAGASPLSYQWFNVNNIIVNPPRFTFSLTVQNVQLTDSGSGYYVVVTNSFGSVTSSVAYLDVGYPPVIVQQPVSVTIAFEGAAVLSCIVTSAVPVAYQWLESGAALSGQTNTTLLLTNILYPITALQLSITNAFGGTLSSNVIVNLILSGYPSNLYQGLIAYYPFNGTANDAIGTNDGTVNGAVLTTDRFGNANNSYNFDGVSSYISFNTVPLNQIGNWTMTAWVEPASLNQAGSLITMGYDNGISANGFAFDICGANTGLLGNNLLFVFGGINSFESGYSFASSNQWYHVVMLCDSGVTELFVNGLQTVNTTTGITPNTPTSFKIGSASGVRFFNGSMNDIRIYNRALSSNEVSQLYYYESGNMPPQNLSASPDENNSFQLHFFGTPNYPYFLQATTNLAIPSWQSIFTNNSDAYGNWTFTDTNAVLYPSRFYRAMAPAP
jgi:hypothetical protein